MVIHAVSLIWMKLGQIEGPIQKLLKTKCIGFATFPWEVDYLPWFFGPNPKHSTKKGIKIKYRSCLQDTMNFVSV